IVIFNDRTPETQYAAYLAGKNDISLDYVEDGLAAYIPPIEKAPNFFHGILAKFLFGRYYYNIITLGTSPYTTTVRVFFPDMVISALRQKEIRPLSVELFDRIDRKMIEELTEDIKDDIEYLLVLPHSEILGGNTQLGAVSLKDRMQEVAVQAAERYGRIGVKYHPREKGEYLGLYTGCDTLPRHTPMELIYLKLKGKELKEVAGPLSTSIYTARIILGDDVTITTVGNVDGPDALRFLKHLRKDAL
ncbi:MAG TPA: polysialyltransferase family glycosyltransferase, partial [Methanomassiliicoccales archaeon]|nr:polysialyltransferase family glycosyltransferase [Methanomassiliicoccales archaeon]